MYSIHVKGITDYYGSPIDDFTVDFFVTPYLTDETFYITDYKIENSKEISINFNLDLDKSSFLITNNYRINPFNSIETVSFLGTKSINVKFKYPIKSTGITYTIKLENMKSSIETGNIELLTGAGSYIVLSTNANNLSDMYVFPNPFSLSESDGTVYFANLPAKTDIIIFDIRGDRIAEISERDGNGGVSWNLTNLKGEKVSSGIYIYRAAVIDASNNETEVKLGKFAITR